jgi:hypothetical protein
MATASPLPAPIAAPLTALVGDLDQVFGPRLTALVAHGPRVRSRTVDPSNPPPLDSVAIVESITYQDLAACGQRAPRWRAMGLTIPLLLRPGEFQRSLDTFPVEYGDIIAHHVLVFGKDPFAGLTVAAEDLRRACEAWGKSHLIHLREGFVETGGEPRRVADLLLASASPFAALLGHVARLCGADDRDAQALARATESIAGLPAELVGRIIALEGQRTLDPDTAMSLLPPYLDAVERLVQYLDGWARSR